MPITSIRLQHFRSYDDQLFRLSPKINMIVGPNGSGKTNLLEALYTLARGKSFRVPVAELLQYDAEWFRIEAEVGEQQRAMTVRKVGDKLEKRLGVDGTTKARLNAREQLRAVLFEPRDMQLLTGSPERRRDYIDAMLEQLELGYTRTLTHYRRALAQRNSLLKQSRQAPADQLFVWNVRLSELGALLVTKRRTIVAALQRQAGELYSEISGQKSVVELRYRSQVEDIDDAHLGSALLHALEKKYAQDRMRGFTSVGPHRDDLSIVLNNVPADISASRGETRTLVLMLKLLEAQLLAAHHEGRPLMLLDDVFGELDVQRRHALATHLRDYQVVITTTDAETVEKTLSPAPKVIRLK
jgi:DNA replication and repair protein RecF